MEQPNLQLDPVRLSEMLIVGFAQHWHMSKVLAMAGWFDKFIPPEVCARVHAAAPFMPNSIYQYRMPVRAYVSSQWPRLASWLYGREGQGVALLRAAPKLRSLRWTSARPQGGVPEADLRAAERDRKVARRRRFEKAVMDRAYESTKRGAWNVCKA